MKAQGRFNYVIYQDNQGWNCKFYHSRQVLSQLKGFKSYTDVLQVVQLLQLPLNKFDKETLALAENLGLTKEIKDIAA